MIKDNRVKAMKEILNMAGDKVGCKVVDGSTISSENSDKKSTNGTKTSSDKVDHSNLVRSDLYNLFQEYEDQSSAEARFLKDLDRMEMLIQADEYEVEQPAKKLCDFYASTKGCFSSNVCKSIDNLLRERKGQRDLERDGKWKNGGCDLL